MSKKTEYEIARDERIARNKELMKLAGLDDISNTVFISKKAQQKETEAKKRKAAARKPKRSSIPISTEGNGAGDDGERPPKAAKVESENGTSLRRSSRNAGKTVDYNAEQDRSAQAYRVKRTHIEMEGEARDSNKRLHNPKTYGSIPGIEVGTWWETRQACSTDAIHAPWVGGISPGPKGAYSIALSGGYEDDVDLGNGFTFTGSGGRDLKGTKDKPKNLRTAPQSSHQSFENNFNKALKKSSETKMPVRVIRGFKLHSPFAPAEGYRYDGLYTVEKAWLAPGDSGYKVCKFLFKRMSGQPPLPKRDLEAEAEGGGDNDDAAEDDDEDDNDRSDEESEGGEASQGSGSSGTLVGEADGKKAD